MPRYYVTAQVRQEGAIGSFSTLSTTLEMPKADNMVLAAIAHLRQVLGYETLYIQSMREALPPLPLEGFAEYLAAGGTSD